MLKFMKKIQVSLFLAVFASIVAGLTGPTNAVTPEPITNLTSSSGSEFVRLNWDEPQVTVKDYLIDYRLSTQTITGSIDPDGTTTLTGLGTQFTTEVTVGESLIVSGETRIVTAISSDTSLSVLTAFSDTPNDTEVEKIPSWTAYDDGVSLDTNTTVKDLTNDKQYDFRVRAVQPPLPGGKKSTKDVISTGLIVSETPYLEGYDIVIIAGQSNAVGSALTAYLGDMTPHKETWRIKQWGRFDGFDNQVIPAGDPLHHASIFNSQSFGMSFARQYRDNNLADNRELLLIPVAYSGTGFMPNANVPENNWDLTGVLPADVIARSNLAYATDADNQFKAFLWHQGEDEVARINNNGNPEIDQQWYETKWLTMMSNFDSQIIGFDSTTVKSLVGQINSVWVSTTGGAEITNAHMNLANLRPNTAFISSELPYVLTTWDQVHFNGSDLEELGRRYYNAFTQL